MKEQSKEWCEAIELVVQMNPGEREVEMLMKVEGSQKRWTDVTRSSLDATDGITHWVIRDITKREGKGDEGNKRNARKEEKEGIRG